MSGLAVIVARGGSKGIKNKNLQFVGSKTLVGRTIKTVQEAGCFEKIVVSTDSVEIQREAISLGACCSYLRPASISGDDATTSSAIRHVIESEERLGYTYDFVGEFQPTYCFRKSTSIKDAFDVLVNSQEKGLCTVRLIDNTSHPDYCVELDDKGGIVFGRNLPDVFSRHKLDPRYSVHGAIVISRICSFLDNSSMYSDRMIGYPLTGYELFDINSPQDLLIATLIEDSFCNSLM